MGSKIKAFTLAEVLITLGIIGVVAALVMPGLIANYQKHVTITQLKEAYSILAQAAKMAEVDYGDIDQWDMSLSAKDFAEKYFVPYLKITKICTQLSDGCWKTNNFNGYYDLIKTQYTTQMASTPYSLVLANGMLLQFRLNSQREVILVDVNGQKGKNTLGKDIFAFYAFSKKNSMNGNFADSNYTSGLLPGDYISGGHPCIYQSRTSLLSTIGHGCNVNAKPSSNNGGGACCAAVIAMDSWEIKGDYPW